MKTLLPSSKLRLFRLRSIAILAPVIIVAALLFNAPRQSPVTSYHTSEWNNLAPDLERVVSSSGAVSPIPLRRVYGGVVSHHIPQTFPDLASFYLRLKETQPVKRFIVLGPDHVSAGSETITVSNQPFVTVFGEVKPIPGCAEKLETLEAAHIEESPFGPEHSIGSQMLLISRIFPGAQVTPIILRSDTSSAQAHRLSQALSQCFDEETVLVASVDFSHYLSESQARPIDHLSGEVLKNLDKESVDLLTADSGKSMETFIEFLSTQKATSSAEVRVRNTNDVMQNNDYTTGYVFGYWGVQ